MIKAFRKKYIEPTKVGLDLTMAVNEHDVNVLIEPLHQNRHDRVERSLFSVGG